MNPWVILAVVIGWGASVSGAYVYGRSDGSDLEQGKQLAVEVARTQAMEASQQGAAAAIAKLRIVNTTIHQETEREIRTNTVYADCKLPAVGLRIANDALAGRQPVPAGGGELPGKPGADATGR